MTLAAFSLVLLAAAPSDRIVAIVPLGNVDPGMVAIARRALEEQSGAKVRIVPARELPKAAWSEDHKRWRAEKILEALNQDLPQGAWKTLAITGAELSATQGSVEDARMGGYGDVGGAACVVSTWVAERAAKTREQLQAKIGDLVLHELGHSLGLGHCKSPGCVMRDAKAKLGGPLTGRYCENCRERVGRPRSEPRPSGSGVGRASLDSGHD